MGKYERKDHQRTEALVLKAKYNHPGPGQWSHVELSFGWAVPPMPTCPTVGRLFSSNSLFLVLFLMFFSPFLDKVQKALFFHVCLHITHFFLWFQESLNENFPCPQSSWAAVASPTDNLS